MKKEGSGREGEGERDGGRALQTPLLRAICLLWFAGWLSEEGGFLNQLVVNSKCLKPNIHKPNLVSTIVVSGA